MDKRLQVQRQQRKKDPSCNNLYSGPNLWSHVYSVAGSNPRLRAKSPDCITVTGTVLSIPKPNDRSKHT
jgi:hypothetical protein